MSSSVFKHVALLTNLKTKRSEYALVTLSDTFYCDSLERSRLFWKGNHHEDPYDCGRPGGVYPSSGPFAHGGSSDVWLWRRKKTMGTPLGKKVLWLAQIWLSTLQLGISVEISVV
ncbi:uncharacterized protein LOC128212073 [Mya arenaria]|uniref:uncharacterized protein LOC128212073 n=1 Tax=Mya arenaria TaxID=6604 RepID=UPI0022E47CA8|nr:uncharacterized protein LOC128212073 [Mya arenaria]